MASISTFYFARGEARPKLGPRMRGPGRNGSASSVLGEGAPVAVHAIGRTRRNHRAFRCGSRPVTHLGSAGIFRIRANSRRPPVGRAMRYPLPSRNEFVAISPTLHASGRGRREMHNTHDRRCIAEAVEHLATGLSGLPGVVI